MVSSREQLRQELQDKGYAVVPDLLTPKECDALTSQFRDWVGKFEEGQIPLQKKSSVIQSYRVGHFQQSWEVRLRAKVVFQAVWGTEKLLSSVDGIAISKPPLNGTQKNLLKFYKFLVFSYSFIVLFWFSVLVCILYPIFNLLINILGAEEYQINVHV